MLKATFKLRYIVRTFSVALCTELVASCTALSVLLPKLEFLNSLKSEKSHDRSSVLLWSHRTLKWYKRNGSTCLATLEHFWRNPWFGDTYLAAWGLPAIQSIRNALTKRRVIKQNRQQVLCFGNSQLTAGPRRNNWSAHFDVAPGLLHMCHCRPHSFAAHVTRDVSGDLILLLSKGKMDPQKVPNSRLLCVVVVA